MRLVSRNGAEVELRPVAYQFPGSGAGAGSHDWDANWLMVRGEVRTDDGRSWTFADPCLTTWEARSVGRWIEGVLSGAIGVASAADLAVPDSPIEHFTEPNVAFSLASRSAEVIEIRVHLSLEALPPWFHDATDRPDIFEYFVLLELTPDELRQAAIDWEADLASYPER